MQKKWYWTVGVCALLVIAVCGLIMYHNNLASKAASDVFASSGNAAGYDNGYPPPPPDGQMGGAPPPPGSEQGSSVPTSGLYSLGRGKDSKIGQTITTNNPNESAIKVYDGAALTISKCMVRKFGDNQPSNESCDFYGLNAGVLAESGGKIRISDSKIYTDAAGANAVFATGKGSDIVLSNVTINTTGRGSARGLDATLGGSITANKVDITTNGEHCAAIATDRGGGNIKVNGAVMVTKGQGSPGIYSTGDITVSNARMTAYNSEAAVIEGKNSIHLSNCNLVGKKLWGVMLYQSFSGDAEIGTSVFSMDGGSLTAEVGPVIFTTNTKVDVYLSRAKLVSKSGQFLLASASRWGNPGSNGSVLSLTANKQIINGDIDCDNISGVRIKLVNGSVMNSSIDKSNSAGAMDLVLDKKSVWNVAGDSNLTSLTDMDSSLTNINSNGHTIKYDPSLSLNKWLKGKTYQLKGEGKLMPK